MDLPAIRPAAEIELFGFFVPWWLVIGLLAYVVSWGLLSAIEQARLASRIGHLPLFFVALLVLSYSLIGLLLAP